MTVYKVATASLWVGDWAIRQDEHDGDWERISELTNLDGRTYRVVIGDRVLICASTAGWLTSSERLKPTTRETTNG